MKTMLFIVSTAVLALTANASTIVFNTFGPGHSYNPVGRYTRSGEHLPLCQCERPTGQRQPNSPRLGTNYWLVLKPGGGSVLDLWMFSSMTGAIANSFDDST